MYLTRDAVAATLRKLANVAAGSTLAMTFLVPIDLVEAEDRRMLEWAQKGAAASGTPFATLFSPAEVLGLAREAGSARRATSREPASRSATCPGRMVSGRRAGEDFIVAST